MVTLIDDDLSSLRRKGQSAKQGLARPSVLN